MRCIMVTQILILVGVGAAWSWPGGADAQSDSLATVRGMVRVEGTTTPLSGAEIRVDGETLGRSADDGTFRVRVAPGSRVLEVRLVGYGAAAARLELAAGADVDVDVQLSERAVPLDTVVIEGSGPRYRPRLAGFYDRREKGSAGQFMTWEEIERIPVPRLVDVFRHFRSLNVVCRPTCKLLPSMARVLPSFTPDASAPCEIQYYVDGVAYYLGQEGINFLRPEDVAAIEVYVGSSQPPAEFSGRDARCGVVVIWTKDGSEGKE